MQPVITTTTNSPRAQLQYVVPLENFAPKSNADTAALHVLEHWLLDGAGKFDDVFRAAREIGGSLSAYTSRKYIRIQLDYYAPFGNQAAELLQSIITEPKLRSTSFQEQIDDVIEEINTDPPHVQLLDRYYAGLFDGQYALDTGSTIGELKKLKPKSVTALAERTNMKGRVFWAGPADATIPQIEYNPLPDKFMYRLPAQKTNPILEGPIVNQDDNIGLLPIQAHMAREVGHGLTEYLRVQYGRQVRTHEHYLPEMILRAVTYDLSDVNVHDLTSDIENFLNQSNVKQQPCLTLAHNRLAEDLSFAPSANNIAVDTWVYKRTN